MRTYEQGKFYDFAVEGVVKDNYDRDFIYLSDGEIQTFRVKPYDFQIEWESTNLPTMMRCYVTGLNARDLPYLEQSKEDALMACYSESRSYIFKLLGEKVDENSNTNYWELNDAFGFYHRLYLKKEDNIKVEIGEEIELQVNGIIKKDNNVAYLDLSLPKQEPVKYIINDSNTLLDPRAESRFGYESDTIEFKSSIVYPAGETERNIDEQITIILKTIAGFQNKNGGTLYIGVDNSGNICGINQDFQYLNSSKYDEFTYPLTTDGYELKLRNAIKRTLGLQSNSLVNFTFEEESNLVYCCIKIKKSLQPIFVYPNKLYERAGNMTQLLKGNEITFFIEKRFSERTGQFFKRPQTIEVETDAEKPSKENVDNFFTHKDNTITHSDTSDPVKDEKKTPIWRYLLLYYNGNWSYQKKKNQDKTVAHQISIPNNYKKEFLVIAYDNGRVNVVHINDLLNPRRKNGRRQLRPEKKIYTTGWNYKTGIKNIFLAKGTDLLVFFSTTIDGTEWCKIHHLRDISVHEINALGNVLVNERLNDAKITSCHRLSLDYHHLISGLILKKNQTSGYLGYRVNDIAFRKNINVLEKLLK